MDRKWLESLNEGEEQARHDRAAQYVQQKAKLLAEHHTASVSHRGEDTIQGSKTWTLETRIAHLGYTFDELEHALATAICQVRFLTYEGRPAPTSFHRFELDHLDIAIIDTVASRKDRELRAIVRERLNPEA
jgi:hypothetical protein